MTGKRAAAAVAIGAAVAVWHELGQSAQVAVAQHAQAIAGPAGHTAVPAAKAAAVGAKGVAGTAKGTAFGMKAGVGLGTKLAVAGVATAVVGGAGYLGVQAFLPSAAPPAASERPAAVAAPRLTGAQLASALPPQSLFPDDMGVVPGSEVSSGAAANPAQPQHNLAAMNCTDWSVLLVKSSFGQGFGETAFAANTPTCTRWPKDSGATERSASSPASIT